MADIDRIFDDQMGRVCEEVQEQINGTFLDRLTKERFKGWLNDCVDKGREARQQDGDGRVAFQSALVPLNKHIEFFGSAKKGSGVA